MNNEKVIGVDEANYSPSLAGSCQVTALYPINFVEGVDDSKKLARHYLYELYGELRKPENSIYFTVAADPHIIDIAGIYEARSIAIITSLIGLRLLLSKKVEGHTPVLLDGFWSATLIARFQKMTGFLCYPGSDKSDYAVAAASIVSRTMADMSFTGAEKIWGPYGMDSDHGSLSARHREELRRRGPCPWHRINYAKGWWKRIMEGRNE